MKKIASITVLILIISLFGYALLAPQLSLAANETDGGGPSLPNPLGKNVDLLTVMLRVMQIALAAVDIFALFMFILGGFEFLISAGNPNMIKKAKDTLIWATLGILVITLSYSILKFIFEEIQKGF